MAWKRNFRSVPSWVEGALAAISSDLVRVTAAKMIPIAEIAEGGYQHVGLTTSDGSVVVSGPILPSASGGTFSGRNLNGWEVIRKDLPMIQKNYSWETPNFGDGSTYGYHTHHQTRDVYQREYYEARGLKIAAEVQSVSPSGQVKVIFSVDHTLDKRDERFFADLFFCINLLQENTGITGVFPSTTTSAEVSATVMLDWEVFPPGTSDQIVAAFFAGTRRTPEKVAVIQSRVDLFNSLSPLKILKGSGTFATYIGALFADDLVVFENLTYGNALYVLYDDWEEISKRPRIDLLRGTTAQYDRFIHTEGWEKRFLQHMETEIENR